MEFHELYNSEFLNTIMGSGRPPHRLRHVKSCGHSDSFHIGVIDDASQQRSTRLFRICIFLIFLINVTDYANAISTIWKSSYKGGEWKPCVDRSSEGLPKSNGYIYVEANGGLNQQRTSICNVVAVAGYLNATLLIPNFHYHRMWKDHREMEEKPWIYGRLLN
ncbi:hypothetical protein K1719_029391 [Acacia pycnantha]|nr:hypothetical protein K1719_029391 [Acacia pycnantha]